MCAHPLIQSDPISFDLTRLSPIQSVMTQRHSACTLWGLSEGKEGVYDKEIVEEGAIQPLIQMLMRNHAETRGFAAACLLCVCNDAAARDAIRTSGGSEVWLSLAQTPSKWLRSQAIEMLRLLEIPYVPPIDCPSGSPP